MHSISVGEAYAHAAQAHNLAQDMAHRVPVDLLTAAGMCGRTARLAHLLLRCATANLDGDALDAQRYLANMAMDVRRKRPRTWPGLSNREALAVAALLVNWWRDPACPSCQGRGYRLIQGTPALSDRRCGPCQGSGRADLRKALRGLANLHTADHGALYCPLVHAGPSIYTDVGLWMLGEMQMAEQGLERHMGRVLSRHQLQAES